MKVECQKPLPVIHKGVLLDCGYRLDMLVEDQVIVEIKSVKELVPIHEAVAAFLFKATWRRGRTID